MRPPYYSIPEQVHDTDISCGRFMKRPYMGAYVGADDPGGPRYRLETAKQTARRVVAPYKKYQQRT